jgi:hypothetical protein
MGVLLALTTAILYPAQPGLLLDYSGGVICFAVEICSGNLRREFAAGIFKGY